MLKTRHFLWPLIRRWPRLALAFAVLSVVNQPVTAYSPAPSTTSTSRISTEQAIAAAVVAEPSLNNLRLSDMGGDVLYDADSPAVAHNSIADEYLVVWRGDDNTGPLVDGEYEIFGRRVDAATGQPLGEDLRLSDMGPDGNTAYGANRPAVAYNSIDDEYLVVWSGDDHTGALVNDEFEIYGQRVEAATGDEIGGDFRLSDMGPDGNANYDASDPAVAYNSTSHQYLVVWRGDNDTVGLVDDEYEIYSQQVVASTGAELGTDFRQSDLGPASNANYGAHEPAVVANSTSSEYLLVWRADTNVGNHVDNEYEIYGGRVNADTGQPTGNVFIYSSVGPAGDVNYGAFDPAVAYNSTNNEYLVVWNGDDDILPLVEGELEIFGQRLDANGFGLGANDFRLSDMGPDGNTNFGAGGAAVAYNPAANEYLVTWFGDDNSGGLADDEYEIFGQRLSAATGAELGADLRLSDMGSPGAAFGAFSPAVAFSAGTNSYLAVWSGTDNTIPLVDGEGEIFGQRVAGPTGAKLGLDQRLSDMGSDDQFDAGPAGAIFGGHSVGFAADVAYNSTDDKYLVVWAGDDNSGLLVDNELVIFKQLLYAANGQEFGGDIRLSYMGPNGSTAYSAFAPAVAFNSTNSEFLVVWFGDSFGGGLADNEYEIYGQRVAGATGQQIGTRFRLSAMGPDGNPDYAALAPAVAYNSTNNEYLVVWRGDDNSGGLVNEEFEIFGQRVAGATGALIGGDFRLSAMGPNANPLYGAFDPAVAYNRTDNEYLVVWEGDDEAGPLINDEFEIFGQRLEGATGQAHGDPLRLSDMGPNGDGNYDAFNPAVAYNAANNEYLVVWGGNDDAAQGVDDEFEIFGQRLAGGTGQELGGDARLSHMGPDGINTYFALSPKVVHNSAIDEYLVTWYGNDTTGGTFATTKFKIFGQRFAGAIGQALGSHFRVSALGPGEDGAYDADSPAVAYNSAANEYLVIWRGEDDSNGMVDEEWEIFGQRLSADIEVHLPVIAR